MENSTEIRMFIFTIFPYATGFLQTSEKTINSTEQKSRDYEKISVKNE